MSSYHSLLKRQLRRLLGEQPPPEGWTELLQQVDNAYRQFDRDRAMIERSMEISSQELQHANADIRAVLEGLIDYYLRLDGSGTILYGRGLSEPAIFIENTSIAGRNISDILIPAVRPLIQDMLTRMRIEEKLNVVEYVTGCDDLSRHYEVRCIPAHNHQVSVIIRDITEARNAEAREQQLQQRLSRAERIESLGILAGGVAHDLNNTLSPLVSYPDLILDTLDEDDPRRDMLQQMQQSVMRATAIIQDLLTLTRRGNNQSEPVDINLVLQQYFDSADFTELQRRHPKITVHRDIESGLPLLKGSSHQLSQTIMNLVTNACEAVGPDREGRVNISVQMKKIKNKRPNETDVEFTSYILMKISDDGCGIPEEEIDHIFEPFFSRRKKERSGTGLGLSIVYGTVKDFGGNIKVDSTPRTGTCFTIRLPIMSSAPRPAPEHADRVHQVMTPCSVLVVDDDENQRELCRAILSSRNYTVTTAANGRDAVAMLKLNDVDIVLLDMIMEDDCDGLVTYETISTFKPHQKCIIVSGYAKTDNVQKALALGVHSFVQKPYTLQTLQSAIQSALENDTTHTN